MAGKDNFLLFFRKTTSVLRRKGGSGAVRGVLFGSTIQPNVLYAFYDLAIAPASFDFSTFLTSAELQRKKMGCFSLHVVLVPGPFDGFKKSGSKEMNGQGNENMKWRVRNVVVPCAWLLPSCQQVTVCRTREEARAIRDSLSWCVYPKDYLTRRPRKRPHAAIHAVKALRRGLEVSGFEAPPMALFYVRQWIQSRAGNRKVICVTLRESSYKELRNSSIPDWAAFAKSLNSAEYYPVLVRDIERAFEPVPPELEGLNFFPEVVWNLELRMALYELSYMNLMVNNGPMGLCMYSRKVRYLIFKMITEAYRSSSETYFRTRVGIEAGDQWPAATAFQRFVWEEDRLDVIQKAFNEMRDRIERDTCP